MWKAGKPERTKRRSLRGGLGWLAITAAWATTLPGADVTIVRDTQPAAVVVIPEPPVAVVRYAAQELVHHVERATGVRLAVVAESAMRADGRSRIYVGDTRAARVAGIVAGDLATETFRLRVDEKAGAVFIVGCDGSGDPLERDTSAGTLFGVYEWLERELGVRWLWPGTLGTHVPKTPTVVARAADVTRAPAFAFRQVRAGTGFTSAHPALGFTPKAAAEYAQEQAVFLRRHRMGRSERMNYGHAFTNWWTSHGKEHPEWFQLVNGKRGPTKPTARFAMCVSNPGLHREIVARWKARGALDFINVVENDILGMCECAPCRAWDGPAPADANRFYAPDFKVHGARFMSERYARFALAVQQLAARENPKVSAVGYAYFNYFQAPTSGVKLPDRIVLGYCPSAGWYPRAEDEHAWYQRQWRGWREAGARLFMRTNYFLDGYSLPFVFAHQFADDFQHAARAGMIGTDFDSLTGHWSTQGPTLYLLMRLHTQPEARPDDLLAEYYGGFGAAAAEVKTYFDHWERYTMTSRPRLAAAFEDRFASRWRTWARVAHHIFPPECFPPAEEILTRAAAAAKPDAVAAARVEFLRTGLAHAKLTVGVSRLLTLSDSESTPERGAAALRELLAFRRAHEREWIGNFNHNAWVEELSWKLSHDTKQPPELFP